MKARIIYNPTSGKEKMKKYLPYVLDRLEQAGYETSTHRTKGANCAYKASIDATNKQFDLIVVAGGDGTLNEVINGLAELPNRPLLGVIPAGTTNDFARALKIPRDIKKACDILCDGISHPVDIGKANDKYFMNVAAGGKFTELTYEVPIKLKTVFGKLAYYMVGAKKLLFIKPTPVKIEFVDHTFEGDILFFLACNTNSVGGFEKLAPLSKDDDGMFDLIIVQKMKLWNLFWLALKTFSGRHLSDKNIEYYQTDQFKIESKVKSPLNLDGELGGYLPTEFKNMKHHIHVLTPKKL